MTVVDVVDVSDVVTPKLSHKKQLKTSLGIDGYRQIITIINEYGPKSTRQREKRGFKVVQKILGIRPQWSMPERIHLAHVWYDMAKDIVGTKDKDTITDHFIRCFDHVRYPGGF